MPQTPEAGLARLTAKAVEDVVIHKQLAVSCPACLATALPGRTSRHVCRQNVFKNSRNVPCISEGN